MDHPEEKGPRLDPMSFAPRRGSSYPAPFAEPVAAREKRALSDALGLTQFGVNLVTLPPGAWSSQRHWHAQEDEFIYVLEGEVTLLTDAGEKVLRSGIVAGLSCREGRWAPSDQPQGQACSLSRSRNAGGECSRPLQRFRHGGAEGGRTLRLHPQER